MNKPTALATYAHAERLSFLSPVPAWLAAFPTAQSLAKFREDVGNICWPEFMGSSPWGDSYSIAYTLANGLSEHTRDFLVKYNARGDAHTLGQTAVLAAYGVSLWPMKTIQTAPRDVKDLSAVDLIKHLNGVRGWHASQYRTLCGQWIAANLTPKKPTPCPPPTPCA